MKEEIPVLTQEKWDKAIKALREEKTHLIHYPSSPMKQNFEMLKATGAIDKNLKFEDFFS